MREPLTTSIVNHQADHAGLHNETNARVNELAGELDLAPLSAKASRALRGFRAAALGAANDAGVVSILAGPSDSICDGLGATLFDRKWTSVMRDRIRAQLGLPAGGVGYVDLWNQAAHPDHPITSHLPLANTTWGLGRQSLDLINNPGDPQTITINGDLSRDITDIDLVFLTTTGGATGSVQMSLDGAGAFGFNTGAGAVNAAGYVLEHPTLQDLSDAPHTLLIAYSAGPTSTIEGAILYRGDKDAGVHVFEAGQSGQTAAYFDPATSPYWWQSVTMTDADLVVVPIGSNDYAGGATLAATQGHIESIVDTLPVALGGARSVVLMPYYDRANSAAEPWEEWVAMYHDVASTRDDVCVFDLGPLFGPWEEDNRGGMTADLLGGLPDLVHPSDLGHHIIGTALADFLLAGLR